MSDPDVQHSRLSPVIARALVSDVRSYAIFHVDPGGRIQSWNTGAELITGYRAPEIIGQPFGLLYAIESDEDSRPLAQLAEAARLGQFQDETWAVRQDGNRFRVNVVVTSLRDEKGQPLGYSVIARDVTEHRHAEELIRSSEERFRSLVEGVTDYAIFMLDPKGIVTTWNAGAQRLKGYEAREIIGSHFSRFYPPDALNRGLPEAELQGAMSVGRYEDEGWRIRRDGSRFWANVVLTAIRDKSGVLLGFSKITRDLTERRRHEEEIEQSEQRFRLLVEGVTEYAIIMLDQDGLVSSWNAGAERIKGYKSQEILGKHLSRFYPPEDVLGNKPWRQLARARETGRATDEGWRMRKDGSLFWANATITTLRDNDGRIYGFAKVTQDLTQRRHAESLADTAQRMHEFIAMLAHELRNPLAPIRSAVTIMGRRGLQDPALESMRQIIDRQSMLLTRLLDELLDVNRIARGEFDIDRDPTDLLEVLARSLETSRPLIEARGHSLHISLPEQPILVSGDRVRMIQAVLNLLNNAAKYTPTGGNIWLTLSVQGKEASIVVKDDGEGIPPDKLEKVFDLFTQLESASGKPFGGMGVGLALVRRIVDLHGGTVRAQSPGVGKGSTFVVKIPLSTGQLALAGRAAPPDVQIEARRVLVVDDNHDAADSLHLLVQSLNQDARVVYGGDAAIEAATAFRPDIVFLDIGMPEMGGYDVARRLRRDKRTASTTLVAVTGWGQEADRQRALEAGFDYHFVKPITDESIRRVLLDTTVHRPVYGNAAREPPSAEKHAPVE